MKRKCCIVGAGPSEAYIIDGAYVIAADAGIRKLEALGVSADLIIGDFDSSDNAPSGDNVIIYPVEKDDTDTLLALKEGLKRGFDEFYISGGMGGKLDHTIANIQTLAFAYENGVRAYLVGNGQCVFMLSAGEIVVFKEKNNGRISVFAFGGDAEGVSISGLKYSAEKIVLKSNFPLGVSNGFIGGEAEIRLEKGLLLIVFDGGCDDIKEIK